MNKKSAIVLIEAIISIFILFTFLIILNQMYFNNYSEESRFVSTVYEIFIDKEFNQCLDTLEFGCYYNKDVCLESINRYYRNDVILCLSDGDISPVLPQKSVSIHRSFRSIKNNELNRHFITLYLILD